MSTGEGIPQIILPGEYAILGDRELERVPTGKGFTVLGASRPPVGKRAGAFGGPTEAEPGDTTTPENVAAIRAHELGHLGVFAQILDRRTFIAEHPVAGFEPPLLQIVGQTALDILVNHRWPELTRDLPLGQPPEFTKHNAGDYAAAMNALAYLKVLSLSPAAPKRAERLKVQAARIPKATRRAIDTLTAEISTMAEARGDVTAQFVRAVNDLRKLIDLPPSNSPSHRNMLQKLMQSMGGVAEPGDFRARWGKMHHVTLPLTENAFAKRGMTERRYGYVGACTRPHRYFTDWRMFSVPRRTPALTILVDCSGSMHLSDEQIESVLDHNPGATIALYRADMGSGGLIHVAQGGRRASGKAVNAAVHQWAGANVIDGPALRWLAGHPGEKVWISDGHVTGIGDCGGSHLSEEAIDIRDSYGIKQYQDPRAYLRTLPPRKAT